MASALEASGAELTYEIHPGGHEGAYWEQHFPEYLRFYAAQLARC